MFEFFFFAADVLLVCILGYRNYRKVFDLINNYGIGDNERVVKDYVWFVSCTWLSCFLMFKL